jgi:PKD domain
VSKTPAVTETSCSRRTATIASLLFLLVLLPAHSQIPSPSPTPLRQNPRTVNEYREPASRNDVIASPTPKTRQPRPYNIASPTPLTRPPRTYNIASPTPPSRAPRTYNAASPTPPTRPPRTYDTASPTPPTRPTRTYSTASPTPRIRPPRTYNTATPTAATQPPSTYDTAIPATPTPKPRFEPGILNEYRAQPPRWDNIASPTVPPWQPPRRDNTAKPPQTPFQRLPPKILNRYPTPPLSRDVVVSPTVRPPLDITASLAKGVILNATPTTTEVGQNVRLELRFQRPPPPVPNIEYGFNFADGSPIEWTAVPRTTRPYASPGTYEPSVVIRVGENVLDLPQILGPKVQVVAPPSPTPTSTATSTPITPSPTPYNPSPTAAPTATLISAPSEVYLSADKNPTSVGDTVTFLISTNLPAENQPQSYSVDFGDGSKPSVTKTNSIPHIFKAAGNYTVSVTVLDDGSNVRSNLAILVDRPRPQWRWVYTLVGLAVIALACLIYAKWKPKVPFAGQVAFYPHSDWDAPQKPPKNVAIKYGLYFHPNVSSGQDRLRTDEASSILRKKKQ